jgi:hypothetical protein
MGRVFTKGWLRWCVLGASTTRLELKSFVPGKSYLISRRWSHI